ncbi:hypothetical protein [Streptomyces sp. NPDC050504]|uniref:hypothetical protein n=1 Tax=Streptomyces sp. NPDC050504 TaxID=3365618 RepID=UPI0037A12594
MTDRPYTDADLRAEAARQHAELVDDPEYMCIGEMMQDAIVESTDDGTCARQSWNELLVAPTPNDEYDALNEAQRAIHRLITGAADVPEWAINLGADGLEPAEHQLTINADDRPIARIHFAFEPGMPEDMRTALVEGLAHEIARYV